MGGAEGMRPAVKISDLPKAWQAEARQVAGLRPRKQREASPSASWTSVPATYGKCDLHGFIYFPRSAGCVMCEFHDDPI